MTAATGLDVRTAASTAAANGSDSCTGPYPSPNTTAAGSWSACAADAPVSRCSNRRCPSNTSGERHSTPFSSPTGKFWSPAFHFADDAPVQNHRKLTVRPSNEALPSYALNDSGPFGGSTRNRSAGPDSVSSARSSSA